MFRKVKHALHGQGLHIQNRGLNIGPIKFSVSRFGRNHGVVFQIFWEGHFTINAKTWPWR